MDGNAKTRRNAIACFCLFLVDLRAAGEDCPQQIAMEYASTAREQTIHGLVVCAWVQNKPAIGESALSYFG